eukprot:TRINITY_DN15720_c0_g1_i2.p1 TRINITY_DN15720_c0_g1~~TRINITY_DN15720_c0_g1_i2.p1  ORF type:complete len:584 (-),score=78.64 TRINITY_DN15720_c0_g1_i2:128-1879(-)
MLTYTKGYGGALVIFRICGVAWPAGIIPGLLSASWGLLLGRLVEVDRGIRDDNVWMDNPYPFHLFVYMVAFLLIFRTNFAYLRYWGSYDAIQRMGAKWHDAACMTIAFDSPGNASMPYLSGYNWQLEKTDGHGVRHEQFFNEIMHLFSLLHALALMHLRWDSDLRNLEDYFNLDKTGGPAEQTSTHAEAPKSRPDYGTQFRGLDSWVRPPRASVVSAGIHLPTFGADQLKRVNKQQKMTVIGEISSSELDLLLNNGAGDEVQTLARVGMVEGWLMRRWVARQKCEPMGDMCKTSPPILSRLYQIISDGNLFFSQACKAAETPFPFPYHNLLRLFLWILAVVIPFMINSDVFHHAARFGCTFLAVFAYFALCEVGDNLEDPYLAYDPNELPLQVIQHTFNARLLAIGVLPKCPLVSDADVAIEKFNGASTTFGTPVDVPAVAAKEVQQLPLAQAEQRKSSKEGQPTLSVAHGKVAMELAPNRESRELKPGSIGKELGMFEDGNETEGAEPTRSSRRRKSSEPKVDLHCEADPSSAEGTPVPATVRRRSKWGTDTCDWGFCSLSDLRPETWSEEGETVCDKIERK